MRVATADITAVSAADYFVRSCTETVAVLQVNSCVTCSKGNRHSSCEAGLNGQCIERICFTFYSELPMGKSYLTHYLSEAMVRVGPVVYVVRLCHASEH